ncbi:hypothetical protein K435DRAFT_750939 [Dendrothele bispora CBS 962.96]|uniref:Actin cytoskeleton-regulatory complex protein PAN1 n=1 Tax=Dendrothele bispora (strain CBS 962.96) TaxID=1314807 RepID=A0A4S8MF80_DENBC|nr:hypothetical protein K435DRAFT_750939 [Dendrothele bispora CBS 962.96]
MAFWPTDTGRNYFPTSPYSSSGPGRVGLAKQLFLNSYARSGSPVTSSFTSMSQWGQQPGFQYPMQTGFPGANPQFQQTPQQNPQFQQQNVQFQQGFNPTGGGLVPQRTGFPGQPQGMLQPQQTGFPGSGFMQPQQTGFVGMQPQQHRPAPAPPVPPIPSQFQQQNQGSNMLSQPNQASRFLSPSPAMGQSPMARPLVPQVTGYVDPRLQMMSSTFMPINTSMPYGAGGAPQLPSQTLQGGLNLQQSFQQHNQSAAPPRIPWALSKGEKKSYDNIFRAWDTHNTGFISGQTALEVFGQSGLNKDDLARIWTLADVDDRGKLNVAEFHIAMGLIYRRLNGNDIPDKLPPELVPPSARDLGDQVDIMKKMLENETRPGSSQDDRVSYQKVRSFRSSPSHDPSRDATIYKYDDGGSSDNVYKPRSRHVDRKMVRGTYEQGTAGDLAEVKNILDNTSHMLDKAAEDDASKTAEDEALDREMEDLRYKVRRLQEDLDYASRGPRSTAKDEERRRLERELLTIKHEKVPELERRMKVRDERREREKRQWVRDRDRANERSGRYNDRDRDRDDYYSSRYDDRDRPYSRGAYDDRDRDWERERERERDRDRDRDRDYDRDYRRRSRSRDRAYDKDYDRPRTPPRTRTPPAALSPPSAPPSASRDPPPKPAASPAPTILKNMTPAERQAYARAEAQRRIETAKARLGLVATPSPAPADTSVEDRLQQEKKAAEEKAKAAEKEAEEREKVRRERLEREKAFKEGRDAPRPSPTAETPAAPAPSVPRAPLAPTPKGPAPTAPKKAPAPPPPRSKNVPRPPPAAVPAPAPPPPAPTVPETDPEEQAFRAREEALRKQREERAARLRELERQEEEAKLEEERMNARIAAMRKPSASPAPSPVAPQVVSSPPIAPPAPTPPAPVPAAAPVVSPPVDKSSTNPFSRLINQGGSATSAPAPAPATSTNPWASAAPTPPAAPPAPPAPAVPVAPAPPPSVRSPVSIPTPTRSPGPKTYNTAPVADGDDWDVVEKNDDDDDSDDEITGSRSLRNEIANKLFGNLLPRPQSAAGSVPSSPASPAPPPPPPPPAAPGAPPPPPAPAAPPPPALGGGAPSAGPGDRGALLSSIQTGMRLRPTKTVDKSGPQTSGKVLGDNAPPVHINTVTREPSPPPPPAAAMPPPALSAILPETTPMSSEDMSTSSNNRMSVDWYKGLAADSGSPATLDRLPSTQEENESSDDEPEQPERLPGGGGLPNINVETVGESDLMADIDKSTSLRVRSLYAFEGDGPEDLSFAENVMLVANPSKTGGDWWYGKLETSGKSGLFPKTFVEEVKPVKARAIFTYSGENSDELSVVEGEVVTIVDQSEDAWWKAEKDGMVLIVPAAYLEVVEEIHITLGAMSSEQPIVGSPTDIEQKGLMSPTTPVPAHTQTVVHPSHEELEDTDSDTEPETDSSSDFFSFEDSESEADDEPESKEDKLAREHERQMVLQAAGLIVKQDKKPPPRPIRRKSKRRPPPAAPQRASIGSTKELPALPEPDPVDHITHLNDAFDRYEAFKMSQQDSHRLSVASTDVPPSPTVSMMTQSTSKESEGGRSYSSILGFLGRKTPNEGERRTLTISGPIHNYEDMVRSNSPAFGSSWASLVDKTALDGIPPNERKRQEAIFELIATENAYVRDLQLIVEVFYSSMMPMLDRKAITVVFANIEDILLTNITLLSSLEERQKDCRLYIDRIGDILQNYMSNMGVYMEYCVNQANAIKVLQSLRDSNPELASHLQRLRDGPTARNLDLSSYLLIPMQRITRYPLLIRQILHYTESGEEQNSIMQSLEIAEKVLNHINESIREQEGQEKLKSISEHLWIGQGRLDLTAPTRYMGPRRLLKEGIVMKAKSGRKLQAYLCSDILVLIDDKLRNLYRMPIALSEAKVKDLPGGRDDLGFQISLPYPRGGEVIGLRATSVRDCQLWIDAIESAIRKCKEAENRAARQALKRA